LFSFCLPSPDKVTIVIQPFEDIPPSYVSYVYKHLSMIIPGIIIKAPIPLPKSAFYAPRNRYRADSLIEFLDRNTPAGQATIGLTILDISCTDARSPDWGVFGYSYCPGKACIASSYRLRGTDKIDQLFKVAIHELGHTQGILHCPDKHCFMQDAEGRNTTINETGFCKECKRKLIDKGWRL
ncbi:MAG: Zn-dependent protease, partial [Bacteroidota bacterium]